MDDEDLNMTSLKKEIKNIILSSTSFVHPAPPLHFALLKVIVQLQNTTRKMRIKIPSLIYKHVLDLQLLYQMQRIYTPPNKATSHFTASYQTRQELQQSSQN